MALQIEAVKCLYLLENVHHYAGGGASDSVFTVILSSAKHTIKEKSTHGIFHLTFWTPISTVMCFWSSEHSVLP